MKKLLILFSALLLQAVAVSVFAQRVGDTISGVVTNNEGPMKIVLVAERNAADSIVAFGITDKDGKFSFCLVNPMDRLYIPYKGYETVDVPIDKRFFELKMKENGIMPLVDILDGSPDDPRLTPLLEAAKSVDTMTQKYRFPVSPIRDSQ